MSVNGIASKLFSSLIRDGGVNLFSSIREEWLVDDYEIELFQFLETHVNRYGRLPSEELFSRQFDLSDSEDGTNYYFDELVNRTKYNHAINTQERLDNAIRSRDIPTYESLLMESLSGFQLRRNESDELGLDLVSQDYLSELRANMMRDSMRGLTFGYSQIDIETGGQLAGDLGLLIGRMKLGKTMYLLKMIIDNWMNGKSVGVISMEMSPQQLVNRIIGMIVQINPMIMKSKKISSHLYEHIEDRIRGFDNYPDFKFMAGNFRKSTKDIEKFIRVNNFDTIFIDGAYLLTPKDRNKYTAKHELIGNVSADLKSMAEDFNLPIMATVQFNRGAVNKRTKEDDLSLENIAGSDELARNATTLIGLGALKNEKNKRRIKVMAVRDGGGDADFITRFEFDPPNFEYLYDYDMKDKTEDINLNSDEHFRLLRENG